MLVHVDKDTKEFIKTKACRRQFITTRIEVYIVTHFVPNHMCCDVCAASCDCQTAECKEYTSYALFRAIQCDNCCRSSNVRNVSQEQKEIIKDQLIIYRKALIGKLLKKSTEGELVSFVNPRFLLGFSVFQIEQVLKNCDKLFTITDTQSLAEIWDVQHAQMIQHNLHKIFNDVRVVEETFVVMIVMIRRKS